jgi:hypothetical protein
VRVGDVLIKKLKAPIYETALWIIISPNVIRSIDAVEDIVDHRIIKEEGKKSTDAYTYAYQEHDGTMKVLVFLTNKASAGRIAHEANHAVNFILGWHGVKPSFSNDEGESYYLEQIVDKIHRTIKQYNERINISNQVPQRLNPSSEA